MVFKLGSNVLSLTVQRNLSRSTQDLSTASERLSSGQRINRASDDAAGLAISMSLNVDSRVFTQGVRNLNDGLSAVTIADAAINELTSITQRIEELAVQSMNGTFSDTQRGSMQREVTALQAEQSLPLLVPFLFLIAYSAWLYYVYFHSLTEMVPTTTPRWALSLEDYILLPAALIMPGLFHSLLALVHRVTPAGTRAWKTFLAVVLLPSFWYAFFNWILPLARGNYDDRMPRFFITTLFAISSVVFGFCVVRWMVIVGRSQSRIIQLGIRVLVTLVLPTLGLWVTGNLPFLPQAQVPLLFANFSHPVCFALLVGNGIALLWPSQFTPSRVPRLILLFLRTSLLPFTLYFFFVFLPFLPVGILAVSVGLGVLILAPTFLFIVHFQILMADVRAVREKTPLWQICTLLCAAIIVIPSVVFGSFMYDRATIDGALTALKAIRGIRRKIHWNDVMPM